MKLADGYTLMHEHVTIDLSGVKKDEDCRLNCFEETVKEFKSLYGYGVRNILEVTNLGIGRDVGYIRRVSEETGINILVSTGFYKEPFLPDCVYGRSVEELASMMEQELTQGIDGQWESAPGCRKDRCAGDNPYHAGNHGRRAGGLSDWTWGKAGGHHYRAHGFIPGRGGYP